MSVQRVYVGEPGGENLDVLAWNTNKDTAGKARFQKGDVVTIAEKGNAERLDRSWATLGSDEGKAALEEAKQRKAAEDAENVEEQPTEEQAQEQTEGGDSQ